jgi:hypothetical protein
MIQHKLDQLAMKGGIKSYDSHYITTSITLAKFVGSSQTGSRKKTLKISHVKRLVKEELENVKQTDWASCVHHDVNLHVDDYAKELGKRKIKVPVLNI